VQRLLLGSVAGSVLRRSLTPVLVVPHEMAKAGSVAKHSPHGRSTQDEIEGAHGVHVWLSVTLRFARSWTVAGRWP
jgi:hypothetical protein